MGTPLHQPQLAMWRVVTQIMPFFVTLELLNIGTLLNSKAKVVYEF